MLARPVFADRLVFLTRSVAGQEFRLRPSPEVNEAIAYMLMATSRRYGMRPSAVCVMSNHWHGVIHDQRGQLPAFFSEFYGLLSRIINWMHGDRGRMWDGGQAHRLYLDDNESVIEEIAYTMANPVAAGTVAEGKSWPGLRKCWPAREVVVRRPGYFGNPLHQGTIKRPKGMKGSRPTVAEVDKMMATWDEEGVHYPPYLVFRLHRPPGFDELSDKQLAAKLRRANAEAEQRARQQRLDEGKVGYLGARQVKALPRTSVPKTLRKKYSLIPKVKARDAKATMAAKKALKWWLEAYAEAYKRMRHGDRHVRFPAGTYQHAVYHGAIADSMAQSAPPG